MRRSTLTSTGKLILIIIAALPLISSADAFSPPHQAHYRRRWSATRTRAPILAASSKNTIEGPPIATRTNYSSVHGPLGPFVDNLLMSLFRIKLLERLNRPDNRVGTTPDSKLPLDDYMGIIELAFSMNSQYNDRTQIQEMAREVLVSLFPSFILDRYPSWFAKPFPEFSARMCAWATVVGGTWLMGECEVNDVAEIENGGKSQGVLVKRCRFLEEAQCASVCVNSCKIPTQNFFHQNMGLALTMTPDYATGECQFAYGKLPTKEEERKVRETPCLMRCPSGGGMRNRHNWDGKEKQVWLEDLEALAKFNVTNEMMKDSRCLSMED